MQRMPPSRRGGWNEAMEKAPVRGSGWAEKAPVRGSGWAEKATRLDCQNKH